MKEKEFDELTPEEKTARFQKALDDYNSGFVESDYVLRSVASMRVEEAMEDAGRVLEEFKPAQRKVIFEAADADLNLDHYLNPKFSASHMKFIMEQEMAGKDVTWLPIGKILHRSIVDKPLTRDQIRKIRERMQRAEQKDSVIAELKEKRKETEHVSKKQGHVKEKGNADLREAANKEENKLVTLTVAECGEFHSMGEFHENIRSAAEAVSKFKEIPPERMHGIPAIGIRVADPKNLDDYVELDVLTGKTFDLDMLHYVPEIAENWQAQQMIAALIHEMPDAEIGGKIPDSIQKKIDWLESRDKRADELQKITDKLEKGVVEVFQSDRYKQFLDTMAKFPRYSVNNSLLIMMQKPDAQLCQSFTGWKQMGRYVKKGEKGISILAPAPYKIMKEQTKLDDKGRPVFDANGDPVKEKVEVTIKAFKVVKTFDLSQTEGKELPTIGPSELSGSIEGYPKFLQALTEISPVPVTFEAVDGGAKGYYHLEDKKIVVQDGMSEVQTIKTLLHEMAHQKLHDKDHVPEAQDITRNGKEVEAESVAYVVCQHYGINTSDYSFSYVAGWSEGKETPELKASLDKIRHTASEFIYQIDQKMEFYKEDKEQVQGLASKITERAKELGFVPVTPECQEQAPNPELQGIVNKALENLDKKRTRTKESVKSKLKATAEKSEQAPKKSRPSKAKEERA